MPRKLIGLLLGLAAFAAAQTTAGRISGTVQDRSAGSVPGARVAAVNSETGAERSSTSDQQGRYLLYPLVPGTYRLTVQARGFQTESVDRLRIEVGDTVMRNFELQVGAIEQQVTVSADTLPVLTQNMSVESTIAREQIETLPLNSRDFNTLVLLAAGSVETVGSGNRDFGAVAVNGNRSFSNDYLLDGAPNNDMYQGKSAAPVSVDLIREFKVTSGVAAAEYGQAGTQVSIVTRGGTNQYHGSLFEYYRGTALQARDPFSTTSAPPFRRDQFGGSFGGPVRRNRTFFFGNYEGNRQNQNVTRVATVPTDDFWKGDFSALLARGIQLRDPLAAGRPVIPNNRLDQYLGGARVNKTAQALKPFWGSPSLPGLANNLVRFGQDTSSGNQFTLRGDQMLAHSQSLSLRYTDTRAASKSPSILANGSGLDSPTNTRNAGVTWTAPFGARTVNEFRLSYANYTSLTSYNDGGLPTAESLKLRGFEPVTSDLPPMPRITFTGTDAFTQLNYGSTESFGMASLRRVSDTWTFSDALTHTRGRHTVKAGFELRRVALDCLQQTNARGSLTFRSSTGATSTGYTFSDFLMGLPASSTEVPVKVPVLLRQSEIATYIQDDWRLSPKLTVTLGLRHELQLSPYEDKNRLSMFDLATGAIIVASDNGKLPTDQFLPAIVSRLTDSTGKWRFPLLTDKEAGATPRRLIDTQYRNFGPRAGFVYQADALTVVRGGYGIFYTRYPIQYLLQTVAVNPPFAGLFNHSLSIPTTGASAYVPTITLDAPFAQAGASASVSPLGLQRNFQLPANQQWNLTVERSLGWKTALSLGYIGNKGTHLFRSINANASYLDKTTGTVQRRYTSTYGTSTINVRQTNGNSVYNAMSTEVRRRAGKGLMFQGNWTWAKGIDDVGQNVNNALIDVENLGRDRADSDYVKRHVFKVNGTWDIPFAPSGKWARYFGGWRLSGIWQYMTGLRFTPSFASTGGLSNNRPDVVAGVKANLPRGERSAARWFNPAAFREVPAVDPGTNQPRFGNAGRNILVGPGLNVVDTSLAKSFPVWREGHRFTFRLEFFNAFNHPNLDYPDANISNTNTVGTITRVLKPTRQAQFAFRYDF
jgi:hypothetical protein